MHVGLVVAGDIENASGGFYYDRRLRDRLRHRGHEISVVSLPWRSYPRQLLDNARGLEERLRGFDVLLEDGLAHPSLLAANRRLSTPVVALLHMLRTAATEGITRGGVRRIERRYLTGVDAAIYNSEATRRGARRLGGPEGVVVPPAGDRFSPDVSDADIRRRAADIPLEFTFLGNVIERKGLDTLVAGLAASSVDWRLSVVGDTGVDPDHVESVRGQIDEAGVADRVEFTGRLDDAAVADRLRDTHVLAVPSRYEPFGMVYLEAMGFGCVPLATTAGGPPEFIEDGESGVLVALDSPTDIAARVAYLADRERLAAMAVAARRRYEAWPAWDETLDDAVDYLETV